MLGKDDGITDTEGAKEGNVVGASLGWLLGSADLLGPTEGTWDGPFEEKMLGT